ncbi:MAG: hypothetical protein AB7F31_04680 [Parachlamydiales bacterium]
MKILVLLLLSASLSAAIIDPEQHGRNQKIMGEAIARGGWESAEEISLNLVSIGQMALQRGFDVGAYAIDRRGEEQRFTMEPVWEGDPLPVTLFVYIWPHEEEALARVPDSRAYGSVIHRHPIPCAVTVIRNSIYQTLYRELTDGTNRLAEPISEERLVPGDLSYDDQSAPFIHRFVSRASGEPTVTLHAYGAPTAAAVKGMFEETFQECIFPYVKCGKTAPVSSYLQ